ncbi:mandelate racemase/muconate lactonizing enzyme family protein [Parapedobacter koreensis]|uniref:L-alanine-DL-glutamate epimerase n=1 Tax=Parapedobacter koreensis TaxID=332977 RepID=A0A1H7TDV4_9SPHI|nr:mandelate racemase/muconate lactonizing enzyme family protein [Parapedobacter koreensis]SEL83062.1 L-alanine-DL-glutamate epimerase [Parapedobacter koreensis]
MKKTYSRKEFLRNTLIASATPMLASPAFAAHGRRRPSGLPDKYENLIDLHGQFDAPVIIDSITLLRVENKFFIRVRSTDGAEGIVIDNGRLSHLYPIMKEKVIPFFIGKDARDMETLVDEVYAYESNYKLAGMAFWNCVAQVEMGVLDMLGKVAGKSVGAILGKVRRRRIPVYISSLTRETTPEQEVEWLAQRLQETGAQAVKLKIGGRMSKNADAFPGRTDNLIPLARKSFGDDVAIYVDSNGSYDAPKAIEVGRLLEAHGIGFYEEPCPFEDHEATRQVAEALAVPIAGGEQDSNLSMFEWMIKNNAFQLVQPDLYYNGGFIRCLRVAKMAAAVGINVTPHSPKADAQSVCMLHFASVIANSGPHQEFYGHPMKHESWYAPHFDVTEGHIIVPDGYGLGITYDADFIAKAKLV